MHKVAPAIEQAIRVPLIHVVDAVGHAIQAQGLHQVALLGTRFTMSDGFYTERLQELGISAMVPPAAQQDEIHRVIFEELCRNRLTDAARRYYLMPSPSSKARGAQGVIFGCTENRLAVKARRMPPARV